MHYTKTIFLMIFFSPMFIHAVQLSLKWVRPASSLTKLIELAKIKQGSDRLITNNTFNTKAVFAQLNGSVLPFLPESAEAFEEREKVRHEKNELRERIRVCHDNRDMYGCLTVVLSIPPAFHIVMPDLGLLTFSFLPAISAAVVYKAHRDHKEYTDTLTTPLYGSVGAWDAENTDVNFAPSDKMMLMHRREDSQAAKYLESDMVTWYCPHADWTKMAGPEVVNRQQVLTPCGLMDSGAIPVTTLLNVHLFRRSNDFTKAILSPH